MKTFRSAVFGEALNCASASGLDSIDVVFILKLKIKDVNKNKMAQIHTRSKVKFWNIDLLKKLLE